MSCFRSSHFLDLLICRCFDCMATMATTSVSVDVASSKTPRTALDHKIDGTLHVLHSSSNMGAVSTLIKSVSSSLIDGERSSHRRRKEMHDELMKAAAVNDILMNDIKKGNPEKVLPLATSPMLIVVFVLTRSEKHN